MNDAAPRAQDLLPIDRSTPEEIYLPMSDEQRAAIEVDDRLIPGPDGSPDVRVVISRPKGVDERLPVLLHIHGGAFVMLSPDAFAGMEAGWAGDLRCVVVSIDYRLAPEHPFPAAPEDCYAALLWTAAHAEELNIDVDRLVVTGGSAGGALAAALCLMTRDRGGPKVIFQALMIPVLDDRLDQESYTHTGAGHPGFNAPAAEGMWLHYLGENYDRAQTSPYAAPARAEDLSGLPPTMIQTNGLDPLREEGLEFALRLMNAGVDVEVYNAPGNYHGADPLDPRAMVQAFRVMNEAIGAALHPES